MANLSAQELKITKSPEDFQLYARNKSDSAKVFISGLVKGTPNFKEYTLKVFKNGELYDTQKDTLKNKKFSLSTKIDAGLHQFKFEFYIKKNNADSLYLTANNVVCGDAYIITGQSNSHASSSLSTYSSPYCRSFGVKTGFESYNNKDKKVRWGLATGNCPNLKGVGGWFKKNPHGVGVWGMELMRLIVEKHQVPVCIINGGSGSSSIEQNMLYPEKPSLETSFGRLAYRVNQAGLKNNIKAILWHQGETNTNTLKGAESYESNFDTLFNDWKRVYLGLEKVYLFQLHPGCGGDYASKLREKQYQISEKYDMVDIMSTNSVIGHDGCHFSYEGYLEFAHRIFPLISGDFYNEKPDGIITPPKLEYAYYLDNNNIVLKFDQPINYNDKKKVKGNIHYLKNQFFFSKGNSAEQVSNMVENITINHDKLTLKVKKNSVFDKITYVPNKFYLNTKDVYNGPWIKGSENKLGALSFYNKKIKSTNNIKEWHGYKILDSTLNGVNFKLVFPKKANKKKNWIWRARFWGHEPQTDLALLEKGFHVAYINVGGLFGNEKAIQIWDDFYNTITTKYNLNTKVVLEGMSRGGLIVFNWANRNASKVACIYVDAPVCDFKSWPGGKGVGEGNPSTWETCLKQYDFSEKEALLYNGNPVNHLEYLASNKVPILSVVGDIDNVVPVIENTALLQKRLIALGWDLTIIRKPKVGHHPHSLKNPKPIVDFILENK
ncbi:sialate O-acetylesterase [Flavivirga jejuensis]|uniref:Sialate O-acetylesterase n=1 Tax=Flavivirga jejuensis TaxID=870487 RepID=A0ABT8WSN4_9FLAO|nr:sialate O-acetylesterase [Flavivirga jejuensis]MDO5976190.1 sialate O-acetylesterase [Flavivirga jejuensis]